MMYLQYMKRALFFLLILGCRNAPAQDGKIIEQEPFSIADTTLGRLEKNIPDARTIVSQVDIFSIVYLSDGLKVKGFLAIPKKAGHYPCLIFNRGGNREFGAINDATLFRLLAVPASWGYIVAASQYRGNAGGEGKEEFGGKDVDDIINLIPSFGSVKGADTSRIGIFGWSRGGMMT